MRIIELKPIIVEPKEWAKIETLIKRVLRQKIYAPIAADLKTNITSSVLANAKPMKPSPLFDAISTGQLTFRRGRFTGKFSASVTKELKSLGARWDTASNSFVLPANKLSLDLRQAIHASEAKFLETLHKIDAKLAALSPDDIAESIKMSDMFDTALWRTQRQIGASMKAHAEALRHLSLQPTLSPEGRAKVAREWEENLQLDIKKFAKREILDLRRQVHASVFAGNRQEVLAKAIYASYGVTERKARFLARQETNLLLAKFRETQYRDAGVQEYRWRCVHNPKDKTPHQHTPGNVRYSHGILDGKVFRYDSPPITTPPGAPVRRNNPGQDFNCFPGSTPIGQFYDVKRLYRRIYPGQLAFAVTGSGACLEATPNHPVLTDSGWKPLKDVQIGDYLVEACDKSIDVTKVQPKNTQPTIEQIFGLATIVAPILSSPGHTSQFHGDGTDEKIDIITIDSRLMPEFDAFECELFYKRMLAVADQMRVLGAFPVDSNFDAMLSSLGLTANGGMGCIGKLLSLVSGKTSHPDNIGIMAATYIYAILDESFSDWSSTHAILFRDSQLTHPSQIIGNDIILGKLLSVCWRAPNFMPRVQPKGAEMLANDVCAASQSATNLRHVHPSIKKFSRVINTGLREPFGHYVYNLETDQNWYIAQGFAVSNCRCHDTPIVRFKASDFR